MKKRTLLIILMSLTIGMGLFAQTIPMDTAHWSIQARAYVLENYQGADAIYLQAGSITLKDKTFLNGTIEFDLFLKEEQAFPGVYFRAQEDTGNAEQFYLRPHLSGKPDANQAVPNVQGITAWQLYFGPTYSFPYEYKYDDWTHVKILVNGDRAQVFLDHANQPHLSWNLFHPAKAGKIAFTGGNRSGMHLANIKISTTTPTLTNFQPIERAPIKGLVQQWAVSDMFTEQELDDPNGLSELIKNRKWVGKIEVEEGTAANISRIQSLAKARPKNTVFAKIEITADQDQVRLFEFGYSDRVVAILNGQPIYRGTNRWRSRDYRYLGTVGLFDAVYLPLKKGKNTLLMAVSEDFGGWLITGRFASQEGLEIQ